MIAMFRSIFISHVPDSLKFYLCLEKNFNYQSDTDVTKKMLECIENWPDSVNRLKIQYPPPIIFDDNVDDLPNLIFIFISDLLLIARTGFATLDQYKQNLYLTIDGDGPTEVECTSVGLRRRLDL